MSKKTMRNATEIILSEAELRKMQLIQLQILEEFDRICEKHHIKYVMEGGTLLGAVRHQGFIPWDDDIDVAMLRSEYKKFCTICAEEIDGDKFFFQTHDTDPYYRWGYAKMLRKGTSYVRYGQEHLNTKNGVFIDIFPFDGIPKKKLEKKLFNGIRFCCRKHMWSEVGKVRVMNPILRCWYALINLIPVELSFQILRYLETRYDEQQAEYVTCLSYQDCWVKGSSGFRREFYDEIQRIEFEGKFFHAPIDSKGLLTVLFGEHYMTPLPPEKRISSATASSYTLGED